MVHRPPAGSIPDRPGSYQFRDGEGKVIYVGKAKSLRSRLSSYFQSPLGLPPRTAQMVATADTVEWIEVANEVEALMLEYSLIKEHKPRFNIRLRDDKSYPFLAVTLSEEWPRAMVRRGAKDKGTRYYGPYAHAYAIRETLDLLLRTFPIRTCSEHKFRHHERLGRPCLLFHIEKCVGPCVGEVAPDDYRELVDDLCQFLDGDTGPVVKRLEFDMRDAADTLEFERAARDRDRLVSLRKAIERQQMVTEKAEDLDCIGLAEDELEAAVQVFFVRRGRVVGRKGFVVDKVEDVTRPQLMDQIVLQMYADPPQGIPTLICVCDEPEDREVLEAWLSAERSAQVEVRVPQRGDKRLLLETVTRNAKEEFQRHRMRRASDHNARARALASLQDALDLPEAPLRIECFDMSHIQGTDYVGSMVVLEDGMPRRDQYRRFKVREVEGNDDFAAMEECVRRRFSAYLEERERAADDVRRKRFAYPPQLLLVDGGRGQLSRAVKVLEELGLSEEIPVAALAKQFEEVYLPYRDQPVRIPRSSEALYLLQQVRDEAHRFAITYHRQLRGKRMTRSVLDEVAGLGPVRRKRLLEHFGSQKALRAAPLEELLELSWLPESAARAVYERLHAPPPSTSRKLATPVPGRGEVTFDALLGRARASAPEVGPIDEPGRG
ncbi:MAG: Excinuclease ABC subunit C [uncultured Acidimicrobiales bacterium]|uniref:UvrABC system protein C n=1 Tax=uncultured Acidimicrobiales bacterium TaxID=310071 RepID=A0A6J4HSM7_9ACTN|nr:MAG: Excinuclease ABC subunit C [uncultured Acidimicrobiales bacterium]